MSEIEILERTAVPGAGESLRFAQKLGIGEHVPCIVVFTDIGESRVHVLPFGGRHVDDVYSYIRGSIDEYYRANRDILAHWTEVEQEINQLVSACSQSLSTVRAWPQAQRQRWRELRRVAELVVAPPADLDELAALASDYSLTWEARQLLKAVQQRVTALDEGEAADHNKAR